MRGVVVVVVRFGAAGGSLLTRVMFATHFNSPRAWLNSAERSLSKGLAQLSKLNHVRPSSTRHVKKGRPLM